MAEVISIKMENSLIERIMAFAKSKEMNRSEAIKHLIDLGLKLNDIRENAEDDLSEERDKIQIEMWFALNKLLLTFCKANSLQEVNTEFLNCLSPRLKQKFCENYENMASAYHELS
jgi:hypothetical protein